MLKHMSDYSVEQPKVIEDLCNGLFISPAYAPAMDLMLEAFLTVHSFAILMFEGLISNASAILRILIEQVAAVTVICRNPKAMSEYLKFQSWKKKYYGSEGEEHSRIREFLFEQSGYKNKNESALKDYLDYGWIRIINDNKSERGDKLIIKEARLEEMITDINEQLNAFAHGQRSVFSFIRNKDLADKHISRLIMVAGKLFLFLCHSKHDLLENESMINDKFFSSYLDAKILFLDLNARATNDRIVDFIKSKSDIDKNILYSISTLDHTRGLMYQSELNYVQVNVLARAYVLELINTLFMLLYKKTPEEKLSAFDNIKSFGALVKTIGLESLEQSYSSGEHYIPLIQLVEMINLNNDDWRFMNKEGKIAEIDEIFITDFTSLIQSIFYELYPKEKIDEIYKSFIPIE